MSDTTQYEQDGKHTDSRLDQPTPGPELWFVEWSPEIVGEPGLSYHVLMTDEQSIEVATLLNRDSDYDEPYMGKVRPYTYEAFLAEIKDRLEDADGD